MGLDAIVGQTVMAMAFDSDPPFLGSSAEQVGAAVLAVLSHPANTDQLLGWLTDTGLSRTLMEAWVRA